MERSDCSKSKRNVITMISLKTIAIRRGVDVIVAKNNGTLVDLSVEVDDEHAHEITFFSRDSPEAEDTMKHSAEHIIAQAVCKVIPEVRPTVSHGKGLGRWSVAYDFDLREKEISKNDLQKVEKEANRIARQRHPFARIQIPRFELLKMFADNPYKCEMILEHVPEGGYGTVYTHNGFNEFCQGPHVIDTGVVGAIRLDTVSACHWRGDEGRAELSRIGGRAYFSREQAKEHEEHLAEAKKRDHRLLIRSQDLVLFDGEKAPGFPLFTPKGTTICNELMYYMKGLNKRAGYKEVRTPHLFRSELWKLSGHYAHYQDAMYLFQMPDGEYGQKPMNCPGHLLLAMRKIRSYRDLPIAYSEFGTVYRYERRGQTSGLARVRCFTQDDGHCLCRRDQVDVEVDKLIDITFEVYRHTFGIEDITFKLSTRPRVPQTDPDTGKKVKYAGAWDIWNEATEALRRCLDRRGIEYEEKEGEAAFYGPKIDVDVKDALGRPWQLATIQLDFFMPSEENFNITYVNQEGSPVHPVMIHRAIYGALERFIALILEHFAGALPSWLSPVQLKLLPIAEHQVAYCEKIRQQLELDDIRVEVDSTNEKLGKKIRKAQLEKVPYMLIIGKKEQEQGLVSIRDREGRQVKDIPLEQAKEALLLEIRERALTLSLVDSFCQCSSDRQEHFLGKEEVPGSNPSTGSHSLPPWPSVEGHLPRKQYVPGLSPGGGSLS